MSVLLGACCCGGTAECFFGVSTLDGATACGHNLTEQLIYKRERPAHNQGYTRYTYTNDEFGHTCDCAGTYVTASACQASPAVEVRYDHFQNNDPAKIWTWYYRNFSDIFPLCDSPCCAYAADATCCDPLGYPTGCSTTHITPIGEQASLYQRDVIDDGTAPHKSGDDAAEDCEYGDQYKWLQGISDRDQSEYYRHWGVSGSTVTELTRRHLCETVIAVFHREHWYKRSYNSLSQTDNPSATDIDNAAAPCATPKWWIFACTGCFVCSWEVKASSLDATIGANTADAFLIKVNAGEPVPEAWLDVLVSDGIINIDDHEQAGGEIIKKTLSFYSAATGGRPTTEVAYWYGCEAGWTYVCEDFTSGDEEAEMDDYFPQIVRRSSVTCDVGGDSNCHTAAPVPGNGCTCATTTYGDPASIGCNPCEIDGMGDCVEPTINTCGDGDYSCHGDVVVGTCRGVWVQYWEYLLAKEGDPYTTNYVCSGEVNDGYLCRIAKQGDKCSWNELPDEIHHAIPSTVSASMRAGTSNTANLCCGGEGTINYNSFKCPADSPNSQGCPTPPVWGPDL